MTSQEYFPLVTHVASEKAGNGRVRIRLTLVELNMDNPGRVLPINPKK